jgi:membrane fusion protein (multidrug efflux system)
MCEQAQLNLSYTKISAAEAGSVANKTVEVGNYVQPGQVLLSIVPDTLYVVVREQGSKRLRESLFFG